MEVSNRIRAFPTFRQKKRLIEFITKHPHMITCKVTEEYTMRDFQKLWRELANELNSISGAKKSWKQWRKTWQDLRSRVKRRSRTNLSSDFFNQLTEEEKNAIGINMSFTPNEEETFNFDNTDVENTDDTAQDSFDNNFDSSPTPSPKESKVFVEPIETILVSSPKQNVKKSCSEGCVLNCEVLAENEQQKFELKKEYFKLKSKYLRQKIKLMKEHNEALRSIADALRRRP